MQIVSTKEEASVEINMMEQAKENVQPEIDISKWRESPYAKQFRTVIRRAERRLKKEDSFDMPLFREDLEDTLYDLKVALIEEDLETAEDLEDELLYIMGE